MLFQTEIVIREQTFFFYLELEEEEKTGERKEEGEKKKTRKRIRSRVFNLLSFLQLTRYSQYCNVVLQCKRKEKLVLRSDRKE